MMPPQDHKPPQVAVDPTKMVIETMKLLGACVDALARTTTVQKDPQVQILLNQSNYRLWESRYWVSEALQYLGLTAMKPKTEAGNGKAD